jgi:hypothetical protein
MLCSWSPLPKLAPVKAGIGVKSIDEQVMSETTEWLTTSEAAARLKMSERTVRRRCAAGKLRARRVTTDEGIFWQVDAASLPTDGEPSHTETTSTGDMTTTNAIPHSGNAAILATAGADLPAGDDTSSAITAALDLGRIQGYLARDMEIVVGRAVEQVVSNITAPLLARMEEQSDLIEAQTAQIQQLTSAQASLLESIERLTIAQTPLLEHIARLTAAHEAAQSTQADAQTAYTEAQALIAGRIEAQAVTQRLLMDQLKQLRKDRAPETAAISVLNAEIAQLRKAQQTPSAGTQTAVEEAVDKSLVPYLKQVRKVAQEVDRVEGENKRLKAELEEARSKVPEAEAVRRPWWKFW